MEMTKINKTLDTNLSRTAIVFDSAGTLMEMYRVAKDIKTGKLLYDVVSTNIVKSCPECALVAIHIESEIVEKCPGKASLSDFIPEHVDVDVVCMSKDVTKEMVHDILRRNPMVKVRDLQEVLKAIRAKCPRIFYVGLGFAVDADAGIVTHTICTGGKLFPGAQETVHNLIDAGADIFIASGDRKPKLLLLSERLKIPQRRIFGTFTPRMKQELVARLKKEYEYVVMVGNDINDYYALKEADIGILTVQQSGVESVRLKNISDETIDNIRQVPSVLSRLLDEA